MQSPQADSSLDKLRFDSSFTDQLPEDPVRENRPRQVHGACWTRVQPRGFPKASLIAYSRDMAAELGIDPAAEEARFTRTFSGTELLEGMLPYAQCYGGHQFGHWAGQLGDGRAINLGAAISPVSGRHWILQLKGAGPTPYSRGADGYAVLRSSLREFLCSEAMHHLGVPTTRALSLISTGESVVRDMFYDGRPQAEPGAVVCRAAPSFLRFGSYQIFASRKEFDLLQRLVDYTITHDFPHLGEPGPDVYPFWFQEVCERTADLMLEWMRVGFVHGVMNTDNLSILGLTIDYGPYGWLEDYDPNWTPNITDADGRRYRFGQQPQIALWNLVQLANALYPLIDATEPLEEGLQAYHRRYEEGYLRMMSGKLGLGSPQTEDEKLIIDLSAVLQLTETDMSLFFRELASVDAFSDADNLDEASLLAPVQPAFYQDDIGAAAREGFSEWLRRYLRRLRAEARPNEERRAQMNARNPRFVLRNYLAQLAIDACEQGDTSKLEELMEVLRRPYDEQAGKAHLAQKRPEWARERPGSSMLSCSS